MSGTFTPTIEAALRPVATARILYADTDQMGIVYHASFFRYLELARLELLGAAGLPYVEFSAAGLGLPLTELGVQFVRPALFDDRITVHAGLSLVTRVRIRIQYRVVVEAGDREGSTVPVEILTAETRHCCIRLRDTHPVRMPQSAFERLVAYQRTPGAAGSPAG